MNIPNSSTAPAAGEYAGGTSDPDKLHIAFILTQNYR